MPIIAEHHKPNHWWPKDTDYVPSCAWPDDCYVQWGGRGIVLGREGTTAFFEAFPQDKQQAGGFIRGEGETIADAEENCFNKFTKRSACDHFWGRRTYTNGGALCYHCNAFTTLFKPIVTLGDWRKPISDMENQFLHEFWDEEEESKTRRRLKLRKKVFGVEEEDK